MYVYKYSVHIIICLLCMKGLGGVFVVCGECYNLGEIGRSVVLSPLLSIIIC